MSSSTPAPSPEAQLDIFATATRIALSDEKYRSYMLSGKIGGMYYSPRGQEFVAASVAAHLRRGDYVVTTYRGLHDQVAKGVPLRDLWAEYLGKAAGSCGGKGGPMHVTAPEYGLMVTTGVVGAGLPIANGLGLSAQMRGTDQVTVVNFGDGAANLGAFHEALNLASVWRLPVVFVCQNNKYAEYTPLREGTSVESIATRAAGYSMPGVTVDGNDPIAMYQVAGDAIDRARRGEGPTLLEAMTFRFHGHVMGDQQVYMPKEEFAAAMANDPLPRFRARLIESGVATVEQIEAVDLGGGGGFGAQHSDMLEAQLVHAAGLKVVVPSNPADAKGLLLSSIFDDDPVVFVEMFGLYFASRGEVPVGDYRVPLGQANIARAGSDATILTYGQQVVDCLAVAEQMATEGIDVEVVDLRTLQPLDTETVLASVAKTKRAVVVHEAVRRNGFGAELAATIHTELFGELAGPVARVTAPNTPVPYAKSLEEAYIPGPPQIEAAVRALL